MKVLVLLGPNLNFTSIRSTEIYGTKSQDEINEIIKEKANTMNIDVQFYQTNHEGSIIDKLQEAYTMFDAVLLNAGAYTHYSYAIRDAIESISPKPVYEVHMSDIYNREDFRKISVIKEVCKDSFIGKGIDSYLLALDKAYKDFNND